MAGLLTYIYVEKLCDMYVSLQIMIDRNIYVNSFLYSFHWVIPEKIHTHTTEGMLENLTGGGVNGSGNPDARGPLNLKIHPRG